MRTTIRIEEHLYRSAKAKAAEGGRSVSELIEDAIREHLWPASPSAPEVSPLPVFGGSGVMPGVDLDDVGGMLDVMDDGLTLDAHR